MVILPADRCRRIREADKDAILTKVMKRCAPGHRLRSPDEMTLYAVDKHSRQIHYLRKVTGEVKFPIVSLFPSTVFYRFTQALGQVANFLSLRLIRAVGTKNYRRSTFSQWALSMTRTSTRYLLILSKVL